MSLSRRNLPKLYLDRLRTKGPGAEKEGQQEEEEESFSAKRNLNNM